MSKLSKSVFAEARKPIRMEMTPMIDVTFLLLIFFLCTLRFFDLEGKLATHLPRDVGVTSREAEPKDDLTVRIVVRDAGRRVVAAGPNEGAPWTPEANARYRLDGRRVAFQVGPRTTGDASELRAWLDAARTADPELSIQVDCMPGTVYGDVVSVIDTAAEAGFERIAFAMARERAN